MSNSLITEATNTNDGPLSQGALTPTPGTPAPGEDAPSQSGNPAQTALAQTDDGQDLSDQGNPTESSVKPQTPQGAPEKYEFQMPEGLSIDPSGIEAFSEVAKELDLSQEAAQKVISKMAPAMAERQAEMVNQAKTQWAQASQSDKEFGGDKFNENLSTAKKAMDKFGTPALRTLLNESGLGNHPEIIRAFFKAGKAISEDSFVSAGAGNPRGGKDHATSLYPNQH